MPNTFRTCLQLLHCLAVLPLCLALDLLQVPLKTAKQPNMVFILTDDQDLHMDSLSYMPYLKKHMADEGTSFSRHYCTVALCCPSRVSLWTGKAAHNTNVTDVNPPYGTFSSVSVSRVALSSPPGYRWVSEVHLARLQFCLFTDLASRSWV